MTDDQRGGAGGARRDNGNGRGQGPGEESPEGGGAREGATDGAPGGSGRSGSGATGQAIGPGTDGRAAPGGPAELSGKSWKEALKRTTKEFKADNLTDLAAALTYYAVLSLFPALMALVSILGLLGNASIDPLIDNVSRFAPDSVRDLLTSMLDQLKSSQGQAGVALAIGIVLALWSASGYVAAFMRAANVVYDVGEGRPAWKTLPLRFGITVVVVVLVALLAVGVVFTGTLARRTGEVIGLGDTAVTVWNFAKWPVMLLLASLVIALLYWAAPNVRRRFRWASPGSVLAVVIWLVASVGFAVYVANFASYGKTYGSLAGVIVFLVWLWISNIAILLGLEFNAEMERGRAIEGGHPPGDEPYVEPRDTRKL